MATGDLEATIVYYYDSPPLDADNMYKPILDAMNGVVYEDDRQIVTLRLGLRSLTGSFDLSEVSDQLWSALDEQRGPFVYVHVATATDPLAALP